MEFIARTRGRSSGTLGSAMVMNRRSLSAWACCVTASKGLRKRPSTRVVKMPESRVAAAAASAVCTAVSHSAWCAKRLSLRS